MKIKIKVKPNSRKQEIKKISECNYEVSVKSRPENGKANVELLKILKGYFGGKRVEIDKGFASRNKVIEITD